MRRTTIRFTIVVAIVSLIAALSTATLVAAKPTKSTTKAPKTTVVQAKGVKPAKATAPKGSSKKTSTTTASRTTSRTSSTTTPDTPVYTNDVALKLSTKRSQLTKLEQALGRGTLTPKQINGATAGIKNFGQLNAMVNTVLNNPTVKFAELKALMTGYDMKGVQIAGQTTTYSLGQAKQQLGIAAKRTNSGGTQ